MRRLFRQDRWRAFPRPWRIAWRQPSLRPGCRLGDLHQGLARQIAGVGQGNVAGADGQLAGLAKVAIAQRPGRRAGGLNHIIKAANFSVRNFAPSGSGLEAPKCGVCKSFCHLFRPLRYPSFPPMRETEVFYARANTKNRCCLWGNRQGNRKRRSCSVTPCHRH